MGLLREQLRTHLTRSSTEDAAAWAADKKRGLATLVTLTSDPDPSIGWRAVKAVGLAARLMATRDEEHVRNHLRRLHWMLNDESGSVGWRAAQAMAEIVYREPRRFAEYLPITIHLIDTVYGDDLIRAGVLWAIGRLAPLAQKEVETVLPKVVEGLEDASPDVRGLSIWCLLQTGRTGVLRGREGLLRDASPVELLEEGEVRRLTVGELARRAFE